MLSRFLVFVLSAVVINYLNTKISLSDDLLPYFDNSTGIEISLPRSFHGKEKRSTYGLSWKARRGQLNIDTLKFPPLKGKRKDILGHEWYPNWVYPADTHQALYISRHIRVEFEFMLLNM